MADDSGGTRTDRDRALDERYGRRRAADPKARRFVIGAAVLLVAATLLWSVWVAHEVGRRPVTWQDVAFQVQGDDRVQVTFELRFAADVDADEAAVCTVRALNEVHAEVGLRDVTVPAAPGRAVRATGEVPTSERAVTGLVKECALQRR